MADDKIKGTQVLFRTLAGKGLTELSQGIDDEVLICLREAEHNPTGLINSDGVIFNPKTILAYSILHTMGLVSIPPKMKPGEEIRITDDGKEVYKALFSEGAYKRIDKD